MSRVVTGAEAVLDADDFVPRGLVGVLMGGCATAMIDDSPQPFNDTENALPSARALAVVTVVLRLKCEESSTVLNNTPPLSPFFSRAFSVPSKGKSTQGCYYSATHQYHTLGSNSHLCSGALTLTVYSMELRTTSTSFFGRPA